MSFSNYLNSWIKLTGWSIFTALAFVGLLLSPARVVADIIDNLRPGHWLEIPNSQMSQVYYKGPLASSLAELSGPASVMLAWSGATYDTKHHRLVVWGGGHNNYAGNEVYAFSMDTLKWSRLTDPSDISGYSKSCAPRPSGILPDGNPVSRHTYGGIVYVPSLDSFISSGGGEWICGNASAHVWKFDLSGSYRFSQLASIPLSHYGDIALYDLRTGHVFYQAGDNPGFMSEYNPSNDTWTPRGTRLTPHIPNSMSGAIDPISHTFVAVGYKINNKAPITGDVLTWDLSARGNLSYSINTSTGSYPAIHSPGFTWDSDDSVLVAWSGGPSVHTLKKTGGIWTWTLRKAAADNIVVPTAPATYGTFGRFQYVPDRHVFVLVNRTTENVFVYKPKFSGGSGSGRHGLKQSQDNN